MQSNEVLEALYQTIIIEGSSPRRGPIPAICLRRA